MASPSSDKEEEALESRSPINHTSYDIFYKSI
jgi:hypothetical protein